MAKPKVEPKPQTAKTPERKKEEDKKKKQKAASEKESDFNADEVAALLNKQDSSERRRQARRRTRAALGGKKTTTGNTLSRARWTRCAGRSRTIGRSFPAWRTRPDGMIITVRCELDQSGNIVGDPEVEATGGSEAARRALAGGVRRAILKSVPFTSLPADKYDSWSEVVVNFDPSAMSIQ